MIVFVTLLLVGLVGGLVLRRRARADRLAGLSSERPVFSVEPPARRLGSRRDGRL